MFCVAIHRSIVPASGRVATRATKTPSKGVVVERGAERESVRCRGSRRVACGKSPERFTIARASHPTPYYSPLLNSLTVARINNLMGCLVHRVRGGKYKMNLDSRSEFHLDRRVSESPIRFLKKFFDPKKIFLPPLRSLHLYIKNSQIFT